MPSYLPIGLGAGLAAAVLFASAVLNPSALGMLLLFIVPLPKLLVGLGWAWPAALTAAIAATSLVMFAANLQGAIAYGLSQGVPTVWLCYLAYLNRNVGEEDQQQVEWYPVGRMVVWIAMLAGAIATMTLLTMGTDAESIRQQVRRLAELVIKVVANIGPSPAPAADIDALTNMLFQLLPAFSATYWSLCLLLNLWLAGRITRASGRLLRPWPDLTLINFPRGTPLALGASTLLALPAAWTGLPEMVQLVATCFSSALFIAYVLLGLAVIHYATRGKAWRTFVLSAVYAVLLILYPWGALLCALLGLAAPLLPWRRADAPPSTGPPPKL